MRQRERLQGNWRLVSFGARPRNSWRRLRRWHRARQAVQTHRRAAERRQPGVLGQGAASSYGQAERRRFFHQGVRLGSRSRDASRRRRRSSGGTWARMAFMVRSKPTKTSARSSGVMPITCRASASIDSRSPRRGEGKKSMGRAPELSSHTLEEMVPATNETPRRNVAAICEAGSTAAS